MTKAFMIAVTIGVVGMMAGPAQAGYCYWTGYGVYETPPYCRYEVRRRGHPSEIEYYFVYRCFPPAIIDCRPHRAILRSRG